MKEVEGRDEYYRQLTKYNNWSKNKHQFEGETKSRSIKDQIKDLMKLLSESEKEELIQWYKTQSK